MFGGQRAPSTSSVDIRKQPTAVLGRRVGEVICSCAFNLSVMSVKKIFLQVKNKKFSLKIS